MITELEFKSLAAEGHNRIPLITEAFADLETPLSLYLKLTGGNIAQGARIARRNRTEFYRLLQKHGLHRELFR